MRCTSRCSLFPHPLNPPGGFAFETITRNYDAMLSGARGHCATTFSSATASCGRSSTGSGSAEVGKPVEASAPTRREIKQAVKIR